MKNTAPCTSLAEMSIEIPNWPGRLLLPLPKHSFLKYNKKGIFRFEDIPFYAQMKQVYLNLNVYKLEDINLIVNELDLKRENETILNDLDFKKIIEKKFDRILKKWEMKYHCSGADKKELHKYKIKANEIKILLENI